MESLLCYGTEDSEDDSAKFGKFVTKCNKSQPEKLKPGEASLPKRRKVEDVKRSLLQNLNHNPKTVVKPSLFDLGQPSGAPCAELPSSACIDTTIPVPPPPPVVDDSNSNTTNHQRSVFLSTLPQPRKRTTNNVSRPSRPPSVPAPVALESQGSIADSCSENNSSSSLTLNTGRIGVSTSDVNNTAETDAGIAVQDAEKQRSICVKQPQQDANHKPVSLVSYDDDGAPLLVARPPLLPPIEKYENKQSLENEWSSIHRSTLGQCWDAPPTAPYVDDFASSMCGAETSLPITDVSRPRGKEWRGLEEFENAPTATINAAELTDPNWFITSQVHGNGRSGMSRKNLIDTKRWTTSGGTIRSAEPTVRQRQKHQINWLVQDSLNREDELFDAQAAAYSAKRSAGIKYGW